MGVGEVHSLGGWRCWSFNFDMCVGVGSFKDVVGALSHSKCIWGSGSFNDVVVVVNHSKEGWWWCVIQR